MRRWTLERGHWWPTIGDECHFDTDTRFTGNAADALGDHPCGDAPRRIACCFPGCP